MDIDVKKLARDQYFHYFRIWFIAVGILAVVTVLLLLVNKLEEAGNANGRGNMSAPEERVYDKADVLTTEEEDRLRRVIAEAEERIHCDIVLVTIDQAVEGYEAVSYGYRYDDWELNMRDLADDFYDDNNFGYDMPHGDGVLLLDNWYEGQAGSWLSTCGAVYERFGDYEINRVLDEVFYGLEQSTYEAYKAYVDSVVSYMAPRDRIQDAYESGTFLLMVILIPLVAAGIFIAVNMKGKEGDVTTSMITYVAGGRPRMNICNDTFIRKTVTKRKIPRNNGGGGGSSHRSSGGGGSHRSSSGVSHGGGGRRR